LEGGAPRTPRWVCVCKQSREFAGADTMLKKRKEYERGGNHATCRPKADGEKEVGGIKLREAGRKKTAGGKDLVILCGPLNFRITLGDSGASRKIATKRRADAQRRTGSRKNGQEY